MKQSNRAKTIIKMWNNQIKYNYSKLKEKQYKKIFNQSHKLKLKIIKINSGQQMKEIKFNNMILQLHSLMKQKEVVLVKDKTIQLSNKAIMINNQIQLKSNLVMVNIIMKQDLLNLKTLDNILKMIVIV